MWPLLQDVVNSLYKCVMSRLMAQDQDQEVKDCAISCMAAAVTQLGDVIMSQLSQVLQVTHTFWSCRPQPLVGLQPGHPHLLLSLWPCCITSCLLLHTAHVISAASIPLHPNWHPAFYTRRVGLPKPVAVVPDKLSVQQHSSAKVCG